MGEYLICDGRLSLGKDFVNVVSVVNIVSRSVPRRQEVVPRLAPSLTTLPWPAGEHLRMPITVQQRQLPRPPTLPQFKTPLHAPP